MMDGARFFSGRTTIKKAITSASQRLPSGYAPEKDVLSMQIRMDGDFTNVPGGFPIAVDGQVIGGVAAGGEELTALMKTEMETWARVVREAKIELQ